MSLDKNFLSSILLEKGFLSVLDKGIKFDHVEGEIETHTWKFIEEFFNQYRSNPSIELIEEKFGEFPRPVEPLSYWINQITNRKLFSAIEDLHFRLAEKMKKDDPVGGYGELREFVKAQEQTFLSQSSMCPITSLKDVTWQTYLDAKAGKMGIPTPWPTMNEWTRGWYPKDMSYMIARSGVGKTWLAICCADAAVSAGYETLFISCEMTKEDIASREYAMKFRKQYSALRKGRLSYLDEEDFKRELDGYKPKASFEIMDGSQGLSVVDIERAFEKSKAKLVVIDSSYRIRAKQKTMNRFDNMSFVADDLKLLAQMYGKAVLATTQVNREGGKKKTAESGMGQEDVALSDVINWNSTNVIGLQRTDENKKDCKLTVYPIKVRENENAETAMTIHWDFMRMNFGEVGRDDPSNEKPEHFDF